MRLSTFVSKTSQKRILLYNKANVEEINLELATVYDEYVLDFPNRVIETNWNLFKGTLQSTIDNRVPPVVISSSARAA